MSYGGRIAILPGQAAAEEFSTLVHEFAPRNAPQDGPQNSYHHATARAIAFQTRDPEAYYYRKANGKPHSLAAITNG